VFECGEVDVPEYWNLVGAILAAGHQYRQALDRQAARRGAGATVAPPGEPATDGDTVSHHGTLEDYATARGIRCPDCGGALRPDGIPTAAPGSDVRATFVCAPCRRKVPVVIREADLRAWGRRAK
jgi:hypothetical protein